MQFAGFGEPLAPPAFAGFHKTPQRPTLASLELAGVVLVEGSDLSQSFKLPAAASVHPQLIKKVLHWVYFNTV